MPSKHSSKNSKKQSNPTKKKDSSYDEQLKARDRDLIPFFISDPSNPQTLVVNEDLKTSKAANKPKQGKTEKMQVREFKDGYFVAMQEYDVDSSNKNQKEIDNETFGSGASFHQAKNDPKKSKQSSDGLTWQQQLQKKKDKNNNNNNNNKKNRRRKKNSPGSSRKSKKSKESAPADLQLNTPLTVEASNLNYRNQSNDLLNNNNNNNKIRTTTMVPLTVTQANGLYSRQNSVPYSQNSYLNQYNKSSNFNHSQPSHSSPPSSKPMSASISTKNSTSSLVAFPTDDVRYLEETVGLLTPADLLGSSSSNNNNNNINNNSINNNNIPPNPVVIPSFNDNSKSESLPYVSSLPKDQNINHNSGFQNKQKYDKLDVHQQHEFVHSSDNSGGGDSPQSPPQQSALTEDDLLASMDINLNKGEQKKYAGASFSVAPEPSSLPIPDFGSSTDNIFPSSQSKPSSSLLSPESAPSSENYAMSKSQNEPTQIHNSRTVEQMLCSVLNINGNQ